MDKDSFDVALIPGIREELQKTYGAFRKAHQSSDRAMLDEAGIFLPGVAFTRACPICASDDAKLLFFTRGMHVVTCTSCNLTYSQEVLTRAAEKSMYQHSHFMVHYREIKNNRIYSQLEAKKADYIMSVAGRFAAKKANLLEIGCSNGQIMSSAARRGWTAYGIEVNEELALESTDNGLNVIQGYFPDDMPDDWCDFDLVVMLDVLEHAEKPLAFLKDASNYLKRGGLAVLQMPNFNSLIIRLEGAANSNFCHGHWSHFTSDTLDRIMRAGGFEKLFSETIISELDRVLQFDLSCIKATIQEIIGHPRDSIKQLTADYLHQNFLGYKLFGIYRKN
jgi:2-polyprenyl-3-methyl-5-hydroxy-6-metoxy-1,4-benzoquinol methylase